MHLAEENSLHPCISYDLGTGTICFTLAAENGDVHHLEKVSPETASEVYADTRRAMPYLPEWEAIGDRLIRQYELLIEDRNKRIKGAIAA